MPHQPLPALFLERGITILSSFNRPYTLAFTIIGLLSYIVFRWALPKPISDIPYNESGTKNVLGDIPSLMEGTRRTGEYNLWLLEQASKFRAPLFQVFIRPLGKPILIMCDFRESQDILMRRKDFDRSTLDGDLLQGVGPNHHLIMKTDSEWKRHRRLLQDLMSPAFLNEVAGPTVYNGVLKLIDLWNDKARLADGRPFSAETDIYYAALDAVMAFTFGGSFPSSATGPLVDAVKALKAEDIKKMSGGDVDDPIVFPEGECDGKIRATLDVPGALEHVQGSPIPRWKWWLVEKRPEIRKAISTKKAYIEVEIDKALRRLESGHEETKALSAVELMVRREKKLAETEGRRPDYFSPVMNDEVSKKISSLQMKVESRTNTCAGLWRCCCRSRYYEYYHVMGSQVPRRQAPGPDQVARGSSSRLRRHRSRGAQPDNQGNHEHQDSIPGCHHGGDPPLRRSHTLCHPRSNL